jgi:hypothetical protein
MMHPFHSNLPRREWQSPSFLKPSLPGKRPSSLPRSSAFSASAPRKVTVCRHAARETDPAGQSTPNQYSTSLCKVQSGYARNPDGWLTGRWGSRESLALIDVDPRVCGLPLLHSAPSDIHADIRSEYLSSTRVLDHVTHSFSMAHSHSTFLVYAF